MRKVKYMLDNFLGYFLKLFFVINPHIVVPFFLSCTQNYTNSERKITAIKMTLYGLLIGLLFAAFGKTLLTTLGISISAFRIGGGLLLAVAAWGLLYSDNTPKNTETIDETARVDISLSPLAFPMFIGPATLTTLVGMIFEAKPLGVTEQILVVVTMCLIILLTYILTLFGNSIVRFLGRGGAIILQKLGGILLIAMSIEMISGGAKAYFFTPADNPPAKSIQKDIDTEK